MTNGEDNFDNLMNGYGVSLETEDVLRNPEDYVIEKKDSWWNVEAKINPAIL